MKKILAVVGGLAVAVAVAGCSSPTESAAARPADVVSSAPTSSSSTAPSSTSAAPASTTSSSVPPSTPKPTPKPAPKPATPVAAWGIPCAATVSACVDLSAKKAWLLQDGKVIYGPVPIMPGKPGSPTPVGMFRVIGKEKMHYSTEFNNAPMPNSVFFYPGDAFHTGSLSVYSNGCVHLSSTASLKFFNTLQLGDPVQVVR